MGTRSFIGIVQEDGKVLSVYCHWDGYPSHNGVILAKHYAEPAKIAELLQEGDISSLGPNIGEKHDFNDSDTKPEGATTFYGRDRNEKRKDIAPRTTTREEFLAFDEIRYLFEDGEWTYVETCEVDTPRPLSEVLAEDPEVE